MRKKRQGDLGLSTVKRHESDEGRTVGRTNRWRRVCEKRRNTHKNQGPWDFELRMLVMTLFQRARDSDKCPPSLLTYNEDTSFDNEVMEVLDAQGESVDLGSYLLLVFRVPY